VNKKNYHDKHTAKENQLSRDHYQANKENINEQKREKRKSESHVASLLSNKKAKYDDQRVDEKEVTMEEAHTEMYKYYTEEKLHVPDILKPGRMETLQEQLKNGSSINVFATSLGEDAVTRNEIGDESHRSWRKAGGNDQVSIVYIISCFVSQIHLTHFLF
jgi:hypothetical protein